MLTKQEFSYSVVKKHLQSQQIFLRDYQLDVIKNALYHMQKINYSFNDFCKKSPVRELIVAPTGSGKTLMSLSIAYLFYSLNLPILFVVHRDRLLKQTSLAAKKIGMNNGFIAGGRKENRKALLQIASFQTLSSKRDLSWLKPKLVIADECHYTSFTEVLTQMFPDLNKAKTSEVQFNEPDYLGITATPMRFSNKEYMGQKFNSVTIAPMPFSLIKEGFLAKGDYFSLDSSEEGNFCSVDYLYNQWTKIAEGRTTISFSSRVSRAIEIADFFRSKGVAAECVHGGVSISKREEIYARLEQKNLTLVTSCDALNEGFDCPLVDCIIFDKKTFSAANYFQSLGRGSRPYPGKQNFIVLDATGVVREHGSLEHLKITEECLSPKPLKAVGSAPMKSCPQCQKYVLSSSKDCPCCGFRFPATKSKSKLSKPLVRVFWSAEENRRFAYFMRLKAQGKKVGFQEETDLFQSWVNTHFKKQFGFFPPEEWQAS